MEVYLVESLYDGAAYEEIILHIPDTDIWLSDEGYFEERITVTDWTSIFWADVMNGQVLLTKVGKL